MRFTIAERSAERKSGRFFFCLARACDTVRACTWLSAAFSRFAFVAINHEFNKQNGYALVWFHMDFLNGIFSFFEFSVDFSYQSHGFGVNTKNEPNCKQPRPVDCENL